MSRLRRRRLVIHFEQPQLHSASRAALAVSLLVLFVTAVMVLNKSAALYAAIPALLGWLTAIVLSCNSSVPATAMH